MEELPITHLVIKLDYGPFILDSLSRERTNPAADYGQVTYEKGEGIELLDAAETWATLIAGTSRTLQWIAVYIPRDRVRSWEVSRQEEGEADVALWELDEEEAWDVLSAEPLRDFI